MEREMHKYQEYLKKHRDAADAFRVLALIDKPSPRATAKHVGTLHSLQIHAQVHFQESDGAKNYHESTALDIALAQAARLLWPQLRECAEQILRQSVSAALVAAEEEVAAAAAEIAAAKKAAA